MTNELFPVLVGAIERVGIRGPATVEESTTQDSGEEHHTEEKDEGTELAQEKLSLVCILMVLPLLVTVSLSTSLLAVLWLLAKEHEVEKVLRGDEFLTKLLMVEASSMMVASTPSRVGFSLLKRINVANLVIDPTFLRVRQASHSCIDFLECFVSLWRVILVWVDFKCFLSVCLFQRVLICIPLNPEHLVIALASYDISRETVLISCKLLWCLLGSWCSLGFLFLLSLLLGLL